VDLSRAQWRKSSYSGTNGCVEVALADDEIAVRDSKNPAGPVLLFTGHEWQAFVAGIEAGEFGHLSQARRDPGTPAGASTGSWQVQELRSEHD
jgi:hypothetical protein